MRRLTRRPPMPTAKPAHFPAPVGGINTIDGGTAMPPQDAMYLFNLLPAEYGVRSRLGYQEWCIGLTGNADNTVRTVMPFSASDPTNDKLFAATSTGIWDVSTSSASPTHSLTFSTTTGNAGWGVSCVMATPAGRFLIYCDEVNGAFIYNEGGSWAKISAGTQVAWAPSTAYLVGDKVYNGADVYVVTAAGTSASSGGPTGTGTGITDGTVTWNYSTTYSAPTIGPSLADQEAGFTGDPANFVFVTVFKNRVWFVERNTSRAWYLNTNSVYGEATSFDLGAKMRAGGPLVGLWDWSYDAGNGLDTLLVGISGAGDVVIYQGTDPSSSTTFGFKGAWSVGGVPSGRRIATTYGGELLVCSLIGVMPLSKLVIGRDPADWRQYETAKITNLFNDLASTNQALLGWALAIHPTDNALLVLVPTASGAPTEQLAMSFGTKGWARYRDLPMLSAAAWNGVLYFGTSDGRVCKNTDYLDAVTIANGAVVHDSGSSPLPIASGTYTAGGTIKLKIVGTGGSGGGASFEYSTDGGSTWSAPTDCQPYPVALGSTGVSVAFPTGFYNGDTYHLDAGAGVPIQAAGDSSPVSYSGLTAYQMLGSGNFKRVQMVRPTVMSQASSPLVQATAMFDFSVTEPTPPAAVASNSGNTWDSAKWDSSTFGGDYSATQPLSGASGMGRNVAIAFQGQAVARTVIVGFDIQYTEGWPL